MHLSLPKPLERTLASQLLAFHPSQLERTLASITIPSLSLITTHRHAADESSDFSVNRFKAQTQSKGA